MTFPVPDGVRLVTDLAPAEWITSHLGPSPSDHVAVRSLVPDVFEAYARILHPPRLDEDDGMVRWSVLAERTGRTLGPDTAFDEVSGIDLGDIRFEDAMPDPGCLRRELVEALSRVLQGFTGAPERCWFGVWEGWGFWPGSTLSLDFDPAQSEEEREREHLRIRERVERERRMMAEIPRLHTQHRDYYLFEGPLHAAGGVGFRSFRWHHLLPVPEHLVAGGPDVVRGDRHRCVLNLRGGNRDLHPGHHGLPLPRGPEGHCGYQDGPGVSLTVFGPSSAPAEGESSDIVPTVAAPDPGLQDVLKYRGP